MQYNPEFDFKASLLPLERLVQHYRRQNYEVKHLYTASLKVSKTKTYHVYLFFMTHRQSGFSGFAFAPFVDSMARNGIAATRASIYMHEMGLDQMISFMKLIDVCIEQAIQFEAGILRDPNVRIWAMRNGVSRVRHPKTKEVFFSHNPYDFINNQNVFNSLIQWKKRANAELRRVQGKKLGGLAPFP